MIPLIALLACSSSTTVEEPPAPAPPAVEAPAAEPQAPPAADAPPAGTIGGAPILPDPIVLGGISRDAIDTALAATSTQRRGCYADTTRTGKVLVRFVVAADGSVSRAEMKSTSLRHSPTEDCLLATISATPFPALEGGSTAIVTYPFLFPPS